MEPTVLLPFFVADKLRGIPLVTAGYSLRQERRLTSTIRANQVEKRDIGGGEELATPASVVLFKPSAPTASTSNLIKNKKATTRATFATSTGRPIATASTTRRTKTTSSSRKRPVSSKVIKEASSVAGQTRKPEMENSTQVRRTEPTTTAASIAAVVSKTREAKEVSTSQFEALTKSTQSVLTSLAGNQRRTPQTLQLAHQTNKTNFRAGYAGENWVLFNRADGEFSFFESMVLVSNILIVSTIFFITIFSWVRSFKRRKAAQTAAKVPASKQTLLAKSEPLAEVVTVDGGAAGRPLQAASDRMSKLPAGGEPLQTGSEQVETAPEKPVGSIMMSQEGQQPKAMAIVQPTEKRSPSKDDSQLLEKPSRLDALAGHHLRPITRSTSDLSGSSTLHNKSPVGIGSAAELGPIIPSEMDRRTQLEHLFDGSAPDSSFPEARAAKEASAAEAQRQLEEPSKETKTAAENRADSLESIELPVTLMNAIKKYDSRTSKAPQESLAPSPNVLLGEKEAPEVESRLGSVIVVREKKQLVATESVQSLEPAQVERPESRPPEAPGSGASKRASSRESIVKGIIKYAKSMEKETLPVSSQERPGNPMGRDSVLSEKPSAEADDPAMAQKPAKRADDTAAKQPATVSETVKQNTQVTNHQVVINKLEKRKTNLEIVDLRDESVIGKMKNAETMDGVKSEAGGWISMDGVAVVQAQQVLHSNPSSRPQSPSASGAQSVMMSPGEIIESRFHVDYGGHSQPAGRRRPNRSDSIDSKAEESMLNNIESELELDNKLRNRKYFVYIVHDGRFTAKKECIARIELPSKRRVTLAELRDLISNSQDVSLASLRKSKFKFVTETYRLLTENEDAAVLHQVYPTQGVFLKLNIPEQENPAYPYKYGRMSNTRLSSGAAGGGSSSGVSASLNKTTIASRRRMTDRKGSLGGGPTSADGGLPSIEVNQNYAERGKRASSVGRYIQQPSGTLGQRSSSSVSQGRRPLARSQNPRQPADDKLPVITKTNAAKLSSAALKNRAAPSRRANSNSRDQLPNLADDDSATIVSTLGAAASDLGTNVVSGAKKLFNATFKH